MSENASKQPRAGRCAVVGRPNVGKSTLLNALLGQQLVIATPKPGTTRSSVLGVFWESDPPTQIAFIDTPGMERPRNALQRVLSDNALNALVDCDLALLVVEAQPGNKVDPHPKDMAVYEELKAQGLPVVLAINKIDKLPSRAALLPRIEAHQRAIDAKAIVPISATKRIQLEPLVNALRALLPEGLLYDEDYLTDRPQRFFAAEFVRGAAMQRTRQEIPYGIACVVDEFLEEPEIVRITISLIVERESHKGIVIGKRGENLKAIGSAARADIEAFLGRKVFLKLWVKVDKNWTSDPTKARSLGSKEA